MTAWDVSTAVWVQAFDPSAEETQPHGVTFNPDGTKMYIVGFQVSEVNEYTLSTPWDISSETWVRARDVSGEEGSPNGIFFKPDGTKMYIVGSIGVEVNEYNLSTAWDISSETWVRARDVSAEESSPYSIFFKSDGSKMYIVGTGGDEVNEYTLSTPWDISSETWIRARDVSAEESSPRGVFFNPDGTKMYIVGTGGDEVNEYTLSTPWDISSETHVQAFDVSTKAPNPFDVFFNPDGTKMYVTAFMGHIHEYTLPIAGIPMFKVDHGLVNHGLVRGGLIS